MSGTEVEIRPGSDGVFRNTAELISVKRYRCPCGRVFETSTNHWGEIYTGCRRARMQGCLLGPSVCVEAEQAMLEKAYEEIANGQETETESSPARSGKGHKGQ
jgi:hypothetical protein